MIHNNEEGNIQSTTSPATASEGELDGGDGGAFLPALPRRPEDDAKTEDEARPESTGDPAGGGGAARRLARMEGACRRGTILAGGGEDRPTRCGRY